MTFFAQETIRRKRDGAVLSNDEIEALVAGLTDRTLGDDQAAAFAMAVYFQDMTAEECATLTRAMAGSGEMLTWPGTGRPILDKHSTGGIGDKVSLILAPLLAACGAAVPMISGRGLGHTGGTLDKLESIPGYDAAPDLERFRQVVAEAHCAIIGQTAELAPADKRLYAIRDVTATVESIPLITASILSKKLAAGLQGLVMDVKTGNGAFMVEGDRSLKLAESLRATAQTLGLPLTALITDMNAPLGTTAGNAVELREALDFLTGEKRDPRLAEVTLALATEALLLGGLAATPDAAHLQLAAHLDDGSAAEQFQRMVSALGGPKDLLEKPDSHLPAAPLVKPVTAQEAGVVGEIDTRALGLAVMDLGGGRHRSEDSIDHAVGLTALEPRFARIEPGQTLALVHARDEAAFLRAAERVKRAYQIAPGEPREDHPAVLKRLAA